MDLFGARLLGAKAAGAKLSGACLREAKLLRAQLDQSALDGQDLFGAALPGGGQVAPMVSAASFCFAVAFSPDGRLLATGHEGSIRIWDLETGTERRVLQGHEGVVRSVAFTPDGKALASTSSDGPVRFWNIDTGECLAALVSLPEGWVAFTPDGRYRSAGSLGGAFWHVIGLCRFEPGELDPYLDVPLRVPDDTPLYSLPR